MNFNFINQQHTATHGKCVSNYSGGTKSCAGCGVSAPSNSALECQNCTMIFVVKVKSIVDLRGKGTKRCPDPACNEPAKSNRALKCKRCKTPFVIKASKRKATATFAKKEQTTLKKKIKSGKDESDHTNTKVCPDCGTRQNSNSVKICKNKKCRHKFFTNNNSKQGRTTKKCPVCKKHAGSNRQRQCEHCSHVFN